MEANSEDRRRLARAVAAAGRLGCLNAVIEEVVDWWCADPIERAVLEPAISGLWVTEQLGRRLQEFCTGLDDMDLLHLAGSLESELQDMGLGWKRRRQAEEAERRGNG